MGNHTSLPSPPQHARINLDEPAQVRYWCGELRCSEGQLRDAVKRVGPTPVRVRAFLA